MAGHRIASGHHWSGANAQASSAPAPSATAPRAAAGSKRSRTRPVSSAVTPDPLPGTGFVTAASRRTFIGAGLAGGLPLSRWDDVARGNDAQGIDAPPVGTRHPELEPVDAGDLAASRQTPELLHQQAGNGIEALLLGQPRAEVFVEILDPGDPADRVLPVSLLADVLIVLHVEFVVDLAHDLLDHVLDGDQS